MFTIGIELAPREKYMEGDGLGVRIGMRTGIYMGARIAG
jgi:hypothetical protein